MSSPFLNLDGTPLCDPVLGHGGTGVVVQRGDIAVKLPLRYISDNDDDTQANCLVIKHEEDVYRRLQNCDGVVRCFGFSEYCIQMELMENGDLATYLKKQRPVQSLQLSWFRQMAHTLVRIHDRCVIVADIATKNFVLSGDLFIKFCDFTESSILPLGSDMERVDDHGYSIYTDIGQLGAVIYEVITGQRCEFDLFRDQPSGPACAVWPRREILPSTKNVWLGSIIEKCWTKGTFRNARSLLAALELVTLDCPLEHEKRIHEHLGFHVNVFEIWPHLLLSQERTLDKCLSQEKLNQSQQLKWAREAAAAVSYAHSKHVLIGGFDARSFLIAGKQTLKLCYFANSRIVPKYLNIYEINEDRRKFEVPIYQLFNSSALGCDEDAAVSKTRDYTVPRQLDKDIHGELPNTVGLFMGNVIQNCWDRGGYQRMEDVCSALSELSKRDLSGLVLSTMTESNSIYRSLQSMLTVKSWFHPHLFHLRLVPVVAVAAVSLVYLGLHRAFYKAARPDL
ncbi:NEK protein kinase [Emergomyces pasteurianus Ep9510]|uniref:NEK protein kinase n=1 Tax=Emergomyces pasteurianus Ep9510 TaxID=1447872 RepID=A0A1J9QIC8_9EURO|nr:NEK protein kinase [Emergomyces pasteurianus Ep9510]